MQDRTAQRWASLPTGTMETTILHPGDRPGLREAPPACRAGGTLVVTKLDRLARSLPATRDGLATRPSHISETSVYETGCAVVRPAGPGLGCQQHQRRLNQGGRVVTVGYGQFKPR